MTPFLFVDELPFDDLTDYQVTCLLEIAYVNGADVTAEFYLEGCDGTDGIAL